MASLSSKTRLFFLSKRLSLFLPFLPSVALSFTCDREILSSPSSRFGKATINPWISLSIVNEEIRRHNDSNAQNLRVYQTWKGSNIFCLGGRLVFGPDVRSLFLTIFLIMIPVILFCAFVSQRLINDFQHQLGYYVVAICVVLTAHVIILLFLTSARDPGIIPRNLHPPEDEGSSISVDWSGSQVAGPSLPPTKDVIVNGMVVKVKYCQTCFAVPPTPMLSLLYMQQLR
ncbi:hypothetical protein OIU76_003746 [Salix suchowensis]|nr:hypothetical protein OIU76_003746 [Salix suchowensis]